MEAARERMRKAQAALNAFHKRPDYEQLKIRYADRKKEWASSGRMKESHEHAKLEQLYALEMDKRKDKLLREYEAANEEYNKALLERWNSKCQVCGKIEPTIGVCAQCKMAVYCSRDCQVQDWKIHKTACKK